MKSNVVFFISIFLFASCTIKSKPNEHRIIPLPVEMTIKNGQFSWNENSKIIVVSENNEIGKVASLIKEALENSTGRNVEVVKGMRNDGNAIILNIDNTIKGNEAYELIVGKKNIIIEAAEAAGLFYGIQSLIQMMPAEIFKTNGLKNGFDIQAAHITDVPQFTYRGMHLDVSRTFFTKDEVKKYIDLISKYKFNRLHLHLTDGSGWRVKMKKYPELTRKTAFRPQTTFKEFWTKGGRRFVDEGTPNATGGYYTQEDVKEIVAYAADKFITVIPEIEMPGHSEEVFVAYPHLSCSGEAYVNSDFCIGNEDIFPFIEDVLTEIIELFPSEYIHIGGDEAGKSAWKTCPKCQKRIKDENLKDVDELQSYFIKRISKFLQSKNRKLLGWDEIMEGGLDSSATVMLWRNPQMAIRAAEQGNNVVMTPGEFCYFDHYQDNPETEPEAIGGYTPLRKVYSFEVVQKDSLSRYFIGGQANVWTEYINDFKHVEYMAFPRALALSEVLWSTKESRNWENFIMRLNNQFARLDYLDVNYHKSSYILDITQRTEIPQKHVEVKFESEQHLPVIRYTSDGTSPTVNSTLYQKPIILDKTVPLTAAIFEGDVPQKIFNRNVGYHMAVGKKVEYHKKWNSYPAGGETALVDGLRGGLTYMDKLWQGFLSNLDVTIDLGEVMKVNTFNANFMQLTGPGVYMPEYVEVFVSVDGNNFEKIFKIENDVPSNYDRLRFKDFSGSLNGKEARYIKVFGKIQRGFLFVDELVIN